MVENQQGETRPLTMEGINAFKKAYFERADYSYWQDRLVWAWRRHAELKRPANKSKQLVDAYAIYMQVAEILVIMMHSLSVKPDKFMMALALDNTGINDFAKETKNNTRFLRGFTENFIYKIRGGNPTNEQLDSDVWLLQECLDDYIDNHNFLNSYKHGFRVHSTSGPNYLAIGRTGAEMFKMVEGDSQITYYGFKFKDHVVRSMHETTISFQHQRVFGKSMFLIIYLMNIRISMLHALGGGRKKKLHYPKFTITDNDGWRKSFGESRFTNELFRFVSSGDQS